LEAEAVTVLPFIPNVTLLLLEKITCPKAALVVPAEIDPGPIPAPTLAVMMLPALVPNVMPFALLKPNVENKNDPFEADAATG
jgi:hypothetical protein